MIVISRVVVIRMAIAIVLTNSVGGTYSGFMDIYIYIYIYIWVCSFSLVKRDLIEGSSRAGR